MLGHLCYNVCLAAPRADRSTISSARNLHFVEVGMPVLVVVGAQWGDEGKGGIVDHLAAQSTVVARYQGGTNAGHTVVNDLGTFRLHLVPSGIFDPSVTCIIGNGVVVNPSELIAEMDVLLGLGISVDRLYVSDRAHLVMPFHPILDGLEEDARGEASIGTTRRGIGPAYADKAARVGLRMCDLVDLPGLRDRVYEAVQRNNRIITAFYGSHPLDPSIVYDELWHYAERLRPYVVDTAALLHGAIRRGENILLEGAQATLLDIDHGTYPYVTSSSAIAGGACVGLGIGPTDIHRVLGVFKAYVTRVGAGPFPTELAAEAGDELRERGQEYGTTTGRPRRCGWFDAVVGRHAVRTNGMSAAAVTKLDVLDDYPVVRVCSGYRLDGKLIDYLPASLTVYARCEPVWEELPGWLAPTSKARTLAELPANARRYLDCLGELIECPIELVSVGKHRRETIAVNGSFAPA
jgi:adenylosuccinate synthase